MTTTEVTSIKEKFNPPNPVPGKPIEETNQVKALDLFVLRYRNRREIPEFVFRAHSQQDAISKGMALCQKMGWNFIWVHPFVHDIDRMLSGEISPPKTPNDILRDQTKPPVMSAHKESGI